MIKELTKEELINQLEITDNGLYVIYGSKPSGKTTFIRELEKRFTIIHAPIGRLTRAKAKNLIKQTFPILVECNQYPTDGAHEFITGFVNFDKEAK